MENLSSIQISKEFKEVLRREKRNNESYESYIKRLRISSIELSIDDSIDKIEGGIPEIPDFERVYFKDGFDCLVHKSIAKKFRELSEEDLQETFIEGNKKIVDVKDSIIT